MKISLPSHIKVMCLHKSLSVIIICNCTTLGSCLLCFLAFSNLKHVMIPFLGRKAFVHFLICYVPETLPLLPSVWSLYIFIFFSPERCFLGTLLLVHVLPILPCTYIQPSWFPMPIGCFHCDPKSFLRYLCNNGCHSLSHLVCVPTQSNRTRREDFISENRNFFTLQSTPLNYRFSLSLPID